MESTEITGFKIQSGTKKEINIYMSIHWCLTELLALEYVLVALAPLCEAYLKPMGYVTCMLCCRNLHDGFPLGSSMEYVCLLPCIHVFHGHSFLSGDSNP